MSTVRPEPVEGQCFDGLSTNELANKSGRTNSFYDQQSFDRRGYLSLKYEFK